MRNLMMVAAGATLLAAGPAYGQTLKSDEVFSSIAVRPVSTPSPVTGADGRVHLAYELLVSNASKLFVTVERFEALDPAGKVLWTASDDKLAGMSTNYGGGGTTVGPGGTTVIFADVSFARGQPLPKAVSARMTVSRKLAGPDGKPAPYPSTEAVPPSGTFVTAAVPVSGQARVIDAPLRGGNWLAMNGCCDAVTTHRGAVMAVNGTLRVPERFAIDWMQMDPQDRVGAGDPSSLKSYLYYGATIYSVADGTVVNLYDSADEQVPGRPPTGIVPSNVAGNMVVVDIGQGHYAFYAHLQRGSLRVKMGDKVRTGQELGLLGNTGNSDAPHLHFHVMDGPSPLDANGLPYVIRRFSSRGVLGAGAIEAMDSGKPAIIDSRLSGEHRDALPLNNQVVSFP